MNTNQTGPRFSLLNELDRGFNQIVKEVLQKSPSADLTPPMTVIELDDRYIVELDVPGVRETDFAVSFTDGVLSVSGQRQLSGHEQQRVIVNERPEGPFERTVKVDNDIKADTIDAVYDAGVLTVTLQKAETVLPRQIPVRAAEKS